MKITLTGIYVDDQDKALKFYTQTLGFLKKTDVSNGPYRWLTVVSPEDPNGTELILELNSNPAAKTYQKALYDQNLPAEQFEVADVRAEYERLKALGVKFTKEPMDVMPGVTIAILDDTCGNLIQIQRTPRR